MSAVLRFLVVVAVALGVSPLAAFAAPTVPSMAMRAVVGGQERSAVQVGERVQLQVVLYNPSRQPVESVQSWIEYPANLFRFESISQESPFDLAAPGENEGSGGLIKIGRGVLSNSAPEGNEIVVATASLTATAAGAATFRFSPDHVSANVVDGNGQINNIVDQVQELTLQVGNTTGGSLPAGSGSLGGGIVALPGGGTSGGVNDGVVIDTPIYGGGTVNSGMPSGEINLGDLYRLPNGTTAYNGTTGATNAMTGPELIEAVAVNGKLRLVWQRLNGVDAYFVFISPDMDKPWKKVRVESAFNALEIGGLTEGQLYYVAVGNAKNGNESLPGTPRVVLYSPQLKQSYVETVRQAAPVNVISTPTEPLPTVRKPAPSRLSETGVGTTALAGAALLALAGAGVWLRRRSSII